MNVDLENPDLTIFIEIAEKAVYVYFEKIKGPGGLPVGASGRVLTLISSGIDSPVAAWYLMKRGCQTDFIHFHGYPQTGKASIENVKVIVGALNKWQNCKFRLYLVPLLEIQKEIIAKASIEYRVVMYRYFMFQIAAAITQPHYKALVTGESLGQVASQTLDNIYALHKSLNVPPILRPLIGMDKEEIISRARKIGTYDISIRPYEDCCSFFVPKHPVTRADVSVILKIAESINKKLIKQTLEKVEIIEF